MDEEPYGKIYHNMENKKLVNHLKYHWIYSWLEIEYSSTGQALRFALAGSLLVDLEEKLLEKEIL